MENIKIDNDKINLINVELKSLNKESSYLQYIRNSFLRAFELIDNGFTYKFINGPINKKKFLKKRFLGITEYVAHKYKEKKFAMLIYNNILSVCPLTTHVPLKHVVKKINRKSIIEKVQIIDHFFRRYIKKKPKIAITGLNPHCESIDKINEDEKIIKPAIKFCNKKHFSVKGPFPADTIFLQKNRRNFDVILGMYHDQVLTPIKTLFEYNAINITMGLPFLRVTPDHGPNEKMFGKNQSSPQSLIQALKFLDNK